MPVSILSRRALLCSTSVTSLTVAVGGCCQLFPVFCDIAGDLDKIANAVSQQATTVFAALKKIWPHAFPQPIQTAITDFLTAAGNAYNGAEAVIAATKAGTSTPDRINDVITAIFAFVAALDKLADAVAQLLGTVDPGLSAILSTAAVVVGLALSVAQWVAQQLGYKPPAAPPPAPVAAPAPPPSPYEVLAPIARPAPSHIFQDKAFAAAQTPPDQARLQLPATRP
jgi:hypothetical protein